MTKLEWKKKFGIQNFLDPTHTHTYTHTNKSVIEKKREKRRSLIGSELKSDNREFPCRVNEEIGGETKRSFLYQKIIFGPAEVVFERDFVLFFK